MLAREVLHLYVTAPATDAADKQVYIRAATAVSKHRENTCVYVRALFFYFLQIKPPHTRTLGSRDLTYFAVANTPFISIILYTYMFLSSFLSSKSRPVSPQSHADDYIRRNFFHPLYAFSQLFTRYSNFTSIHHYFSTSYFNVHLSAITYRDPTI